MTASLVAHNLFSFADGDLGHVVDLGSAPAVGDIDAFCVISVTVIDSVSGLGSALNSHLNNDDVRTYSRTAVGGEGSTFTVDTSGNFNTMVAWQRWRGLTGLDAAGAGAGHQLALLDASSAASTPSASTGALAGTDLVVAIATGSSTQLGNQVGSWPAGWTAVDAGKLGSGGFGLYAATAYQLVPAAGASVSYSWTGDGVNNNHTATLAYVVAPEPAAAASPDVPMHRRRRR